ncbi:unnamed protein product [Periconia digitata]|uniref:DUF572-domain-containing protein n=1 Tax=Periconia digitata TaxID=1303443 RepID=A0A9W4UCN9_9PLEO|nr:unnamed protein product [Periconia digitata]
MQGFNMGRYYPPDSSNPPRFNTSKTTPGTLTIRFELPFSVWCNHCTPSTHIGQGVRFNAAKQKVGAYHSTPIWSFRMKHSACGGSWEIRTDPQNAAYVCHEGCRRREDGSEVVGDGRPGFEDGGGEGEIKFLSEEERRARREDAFRGFEGRVEEKREDGAWRERFDELYRAAEVWRDPYEVNAKLRREMRGRRKAAKREEREGERVKDKFSLGLDVLPAEREDGVQARAVEFGGAKAEESVRQIMNRPLFDGAVLPRPSSSSGLPSSAPAVSKLAESIPPLSSSSSAITASPTPPQNKKNPLLKSEQKSQQTRTSLHKSLVTNSRAAIDPFLSPHPSTSAISGQKPSSLGLLKRKRDGEIKDGECNIIEEKKGEEEGIGRKKIDDGGVEEREVSVGGKDFEGVNGKGRLVGYEYFHSLPPFFDSMLRIRFLALLPLFRLVLLYSSDVLLLGWYRGRGRRKKKITGKKQATSGSNPQYLLDYIKLQLLSSLSIHTRVHSTNGIADPHVLLSPHLIFDNLNYSQPRLFSLQAFDFFLDSVSSPAGMCMCMNDLLIFMTCFPDRGSTRLWIGSFEWDLREQQHVYVSMYLCVQANLGL